MKTTYKLLPLSIALGIIYFTACRDREDEFVQQKGFGFFSGDFGFRDDYKRKGSFLFQSDGGYRSSRENHVQTMRGFLWENGSVVLQVKGGKVNLGPFELEPVKERAFPESEDVYSYRLPRDWRSLDRHAAKAVFGTTIDIKMDAPLSNPAARTEETTTLSGSLRIPTEIEFLAPIYNERDSSTTTLQEGLHIQWNVDDQNEKGVVIYLEYNPDFRHTISKYGKKHPTLTYKVIHTKDTSEGYTITNSDLAEFPDGAYVTVKIGRANFVTLKNGDDNYDVAAYTMREGEFKVRLTKIGTGQ